MVGDHIEAMSSARRPRVRLAGRPRLHSERPRDAPGLYILAARRPAPPQMIRHHTDNADHGTRCGRRGLTSELGTKEGIYHAGSAGHS